MPVMSMGSRLARAAYSAGRVAGGPEPRMRTRACLAGAFMVAALESNGRRIQPTRENYIGAGPGVASPAMGTIARFLQTGRDLGLDRAGTQQREPAYVDAVEPGPDPARAAVFHAHRRPGTGHCDSVVKRRFRRGELVVEQGRKSNALFILLNGRARVLTSDSPRAARSSWRCSSRRDYVGEMSLIDNEPHSATVRAEIQTDMLVLARADFARCLPENSTLSYGIMRGLVRRLRNARPADRVAGAAGRLWPASRARCWTWPKRSTAPRSSATRLAARTWPRWWARRAKMVSRVMKDLEERGVIETQDNGSVVIKERLQND